ncbi:MAG: alpha/beta hydrolase [Chlamydiales bacterium]|nr:alpha/beta hydrolase [Chlamydiales bacterium]
MRRAKWIGFLSVIALAGCYVLTAGLHPIKTKEKSDMQLLGHRLIGSGKERVVLLHNWFCDSSSFDPMTPYLNTEKFTYAMVDLRGYGLSKERAGSFSAEEAASDVLELADALGWQEFHVVGHSMSGMIAQKIVVKASSRIKSVVAITPVPACGSHPPTEVMGFLSAAASTNEAFAMEGCHLSTGRRYSDWVARNMARSWWSCSKPEARLGYLRMFAETDFSESVKGLKTPMLVIFCDKDFEGVEEMLKQTFLKWYPNATMECCEGSGHFPTQETPIFLASAIEKFLSKVQGE